MLRSKVTLLCKLQASSHKPQDRLGTEDGGLRTQDLGLTTYHLPPIIYPIETLKTINMNIVKDYDA